MIKNDCTYCKHSYLPCDEIFCLIHKEPNTCGDNYELDDYFAEQLKKEESTMDYIYIVKTISLHEKTEEDLHKEFQTFKINHPIWLLKSYNDFLDFQTSWNNHKYSMSHEDNCYCKDYINASHKVINNICDINDGGAYNYACVIRTPLESTYASSCTQTEDITLFKFDLETDCYDLISRDSDDETKFIISKLW